MNLLGRNGRVYDSATKQLVTATPHKELRTRQEVRRARAVNQPQQPSGERPKDFDRFQLMLREHPKTKPPGWLDTREGQRFEAYCREESAKLQSQYAAENEHQAFQASISDLVGHATNQYELVLTDETASVEDCERASEALAAAKRGDRQSYVAWEKSRHDQVTSRLASEAAEHNSVATSAIAKRDAILASAINKPAEVPVVKPIELPQPVLIDRSRRAIVDSRTGRTTIVDADDPSIAQ